MTHIFLNKAFEWLDHPSGEGVLDDSVYCATRDVLQGRLDKLRLTLEKNKPEDAALFIAVCGEIGNNSFDHNIGTWRTIPGVYFDFDHDTSAVILADRGQGIRASLSRVVPELGSDTEAIKVAFSETISGRFPEHRGNGLKFVRDVVRRKNWSLEFFAGNGVGKITKRNRMEFLESEHNLKGCAAFISM